MGGPSIEGKKKHHTFLYLDDIFFPKHLFVLISIRALKNPGMRKSLDEEDFAQENWDVGRPNALILTLILIYNYSIVKKNPRTVYYALKHSKI